MLSAPQPPFLQSTLVHTKRKEEDSEDSEIEEELNLDR